MAPEKMFQNNAPERRLYRRFMVDSAPIKRDFSAGSRHGCGDAKMLRRR